MAKTRKFDPDKPRKPRGKLDINVSLLQGQLWEGRKYPSTYEKFRHSPDLMKIYKILVNKPTFWQDGIKYTFSAADKVHLVFGEGYRDILVYKACEDFNLEQGILWDTDEALAADKIKTARQVYVNDTILVRRDSRDRLGQMDVQVLSAGLLQDTSEDYKIFTMNNFDLKYFRDKITLIEGSEFNENYFDDNRHRNGVDNS